MRQEEFTNLIRSVGSKLVGNYSRSGHVETGFNGPYDDPETEVRYLAQLIIIASVECLRFDKGDYKPLIDEMGKKLLLMKQSNGLYRMRQKAGKDECNGTIGHAWLVEGLLYAYKITRDEIYLNESERILLMHEFNFKIGLWGRPLKGCNDMAIDFTFNHELWFAATLAEFLQFRKNNVLEEELSYFLKKLPDIITINKSGRIAHSIYARSQVKGRIKYKIARMRDVFMKIMSRPNMEYKENGYHLFNLMAFARIYNLYPECNFFKSKKFLNALTYIAKETFVDSLQSSAIEKDCNSYGDTLTDEEKKINIYGYPYNVPGFEAMYCAAVFKQYIKFDGALDLLKKQVDLTWDKKAGRFGQNCHDKVSVNYRVYEYYRYLEL